MGIPFAHNCWFLHILQIHKFRRLSVFSYSPYPLKSLSRSEKLPFMFSGIETPIANHSNLVLHNLFVIGVTGVKSWARSGDRLVQSIKPMAFDLRNSKLDRQSNSESPKAP